MNINDSHNLQPRVNIVHACAFRYYDSRYNSCVPVVEVQRIIHKGLGSIIYTHEVYNIDRGLLDMLDCLSMGTHIK